MLEGSEEYLGFGFYPVEPEPLTDRDTATLAEGLG